MNPIARFAKRSDDERALLVRAAVLLVAVRLGLWLVPYRVVLRAVESAMPADDGADAYDERLVREAARAVRSASRFVPRATCLVCALALLGVLGRLRQPAALRIGVAKQDRALRAHAWVECGGRVVIGRTSDLAQFTALDRVGA